MASCTSPSHPHTLNTLNLLKIFKCNHDLQVVTPSWIAAEYRFSYINKETQMEKDVIQKRAGCCSSSVEDATKVLFKTENTVLSHREIRKIGATYCFTINPKRRNYKIN